MPKIKGLRSSRAILALPADHSHTKVYALNVYADTIREQLIQVVIIQKLNPKKQQIEQTILYTNDLTLYPLLIIQYYALRFQIEFNFRNAKQFLGLSTFKNYKQNQLH